MGVLDNKEGAGFGYVMGALRSALGLVESAVGAEVEVFRKEAGGKLHLDALLEDLRGRDRMGVWQVEGRGLRVGLLWWWCWRWWLHQPYGSVSFRMPGTDYRLRTTGDARRGLGAKICHA